MERIEDSAIESAEIAYSAGGAGVLPATDQELAALLGCLEIPKSSRKAGGKDDLWPNKSEEPSGGSSRLSRFFGKKSKSPELDAMIASGGGTNDENAASTLAKLFGANGSDSNGPSAVNHNELKGGLRLEDLEKNMEAKDTTKVSPLQDPSQHAQLLQHLQKVAQKQSEAALHQQQLHQMQQSHRQPTPPNAGPQMVHHSMGQPGMPIVADPMLLNSFAQHPILLNTYCENQLQEAINAAIRANNGQQIPPQLRKFHCISVICIRTRLPCR